MNAARDSLRSEYDAARAIQRAARTPGAGDYFTYTERAAVQRADKLRRLSTLRHAVAALQQDMARRGLL